MSELGFTDQKERLRRIVGNALDEAAFESSRLEDGGEHLLVEARRPGGQLVSVRFRGIRDPDAIAIPPLGTALHLNSVSSAGRASMRGKLWKLLSFFLPNSGSDKMRVRIRAGDTRLDIVCEDAEWWED